MIRLDSVRISNLGPFHGDQVVYLSSDFKSPHSLIIGANGAGKSSLARAIGWGLYGQEYRTRSGLTVNKSAADDGVNGGFVELSFQHGTRRYCLKRVLGAAGNPSSSKQPTQPSLTLLDVTDDQARVALDTPQDHINSILPLAVAKFAFFSGEYSGDMSDQSLMAIAIIQAINAALDLQFNTNVSNEFSNINRRKLFANMFKEIEDAVNLRVECLELPRWVNQCSISINQDGQLSMMYDGRPGSGYFSSSEEAVLGLLVLCEAYKIVSDYFTKHECREGVSLREMPFILEDFFQRMNKPDAIAVLNYLSSCSFPLILFLHPNSYEQTVLPSKFLSSVGCVYGLPMHSLESGGTNICFYFKATYFELHFWGSTFEGTEIKRVY